MKEEFRYPLYEKARESLKSITQKALAEIQITSLAAGELVPDDLRIHPDTLRAQAVVARQAGYDHLSENLERAAELTRVTSDDLLLFYEALRPGRSTLAELESHAVRLETDFKAPRCAAFIREAAQTYKLRGLLRKV